MEEVKKALEVLRNIIVLIGVLAVVYILINNVMIPIQKMT